LPDCCASSDSINKPPKKHICPINRNAYSEVSISTIMYHLNQPWKWNDKNQGYYFCDDPDCEVVYFGQDDSVIKKSELRTTVGVKEKSQNSLVCYCFGISKYEAATNKKAKDFVKKQTRKQTCACESLNPSGKCCLKDFPKT